MRNAMECNFDGIDHWWSDTFRFSCCGLSKKNIRRKCLRSSYRVYKTIDPELWTALPILDSTPQLKVVHLLKDPRATYASQVLNWWDGKHDVKKLLKICRTSAANIHIKHA